MAPGAVLTRPLGLRPEPSSGERSEEDCPSFGKWRGCFSSAWDRILHLMFLSLFEPGFEGWDLWTCTWGAKALGGHRPRAHRVGVSYPPSSRPQRTHPTTPAFELTVGRFRVSSCTFPTLPVTCCVSLDESVGSFFFF